MDYVLYGICLYGIWLWPLMFVLGFAFGLKRLFKEPEEGKYWVPLLISAFGLMMLVLPIYIRP